MRNSFFMFHFKRQVTEFVEFGDMDIMLQYLKDVQAVQRKISELSETIEFINMVRRIAIRTLLNSLHTYAHNSTQLRYSPMLSFTKTFPKTI